jgi:hypothetical protein
VVRSLCGEVTSPTLRASCVAGHPREAVSPNLMRCAKRSLEAVSKLRNLFCVKLADDYRNQNAL